MPVRAIRLPCLILLLFPAFAHAQEAALRSEPRPSFHFSGNTPDSEPWQGTALDEFPQEMCETCIPLPGGRFDIQFLTGVAFDNSMGPGNPDWLGTEEFSFDYVPILVRFSARPFMPRTLKPDPDSPWEWLGQVVVAPIFDGPGTLFGGSSLLLRYNYACREAPFIPYTQAGAGIVFTDAYKDQSQRSIGQAAEFLLQVGAGLRCRLDERWTLDFEVSLHHISNARTAERNGGVNAFGFLVGATYTFPR